MAKNSKRKSNEDRQVVPLTERRIRNAYGLSLEIGGLLNALDVLDELLDDDDKERFSDYFPRKRAFDSFVGSFGYARFDVIGVYGWGDLIDAELFQTDPQHSQTVKNYFDQVFRAAMKQVSSEESTDE